MIFIIFIIFSYCLVYFFNIFTFYVFLLHRFHLMSRLWRNRLLWILNFKFLFYFSAFINKYCSSYLAIELCTGEVKHTDIHIYIQLYTDITEKNRHQHKYFPIINMCLFMLTGENSSGIT